MPGPEQAIQGANALGELLLKVHWVEIAHRNSPELDATLCVVGFEQFPNDIEGAHILVRLQIEYGRDPRVFPQAIDVSSVLRI